MKKIVCCKLWSESGKSLNIGSYVVDGEDDFDIVEKSEVLADKDISRWSKTYKTLDFDMDNILKSGLFNELIKQVRVVFCGDDSFTIFDADNDNAWIKFYIYNNDIGAGIVSSDEFKWLGQLYRANGLRSDLCRIRVNKIGVMETEMPQLLGKEVYLDIHNGTESYYSQIQSKLLYK